MAAQAQIYSCLWQPENQTAAEIIPILTKGIALMRTDPEQFKQYDAHNGWGTYDQFLPWLEEVLQACITHPTYKLEACV